MLPSISKSRPQPDEITPAVLHTRAPVLVYLFRVFPVQFVTTILPDASTAVQPAVGTLQLEMNAPALEYFETRPLVL